MALLEDAKSEVPNKQLAEQQVTYILSIDEAEYWSLAHDMYLELLLYFRTQHP